MCTSIKKIPTTVILNTQKWKITAIITNYKALTRIYGNNKKQIQTISLKKKVCTVYGGGVSKTVLRKISYGISFLLHIQKIWFASKFQDNQNLSWEPKGKWCSVVFYILFNIHQKKKKGGTETDKKRKKDQIQQVNLQDKISPPALVTFKTISRRDSIINSTDALKRKRHRDTI